MLGLRGPAEPLRKTPAWTRIHDAVERDLVHLSVFGPHRVNELELARHFGVGRMVARDVLLRLESLGMLEKDSRQRWQLIALDRARITQLFELRWLLEPAALRAAAAAAPAGVVAGMVAFAAPGDAPLPQAPPAPTWTRWSRRCTWSCCRTAPTATCCTACSAPAAC